MPFTLSIYCSPDISIRVHSITISYYSYLFLLIYKESISIFTYRSWTAPTERPLSSCSYIFNESAPLNLFSHRGAMSVCVCVCLSAPSDAVFTKASHWPWDHMIISRDSVSPVCGMFCWSNFNLEPGKSRTFLLDIRLIYSVEIVVNSCVILCILTKKNVIPPIFSIRHNIVVSYLDAKIC